MKLQSFVYRTRIPASAEVVFQWHTRPGAFERLTPPWERVEVVERTGGIESGARVTVLTYLGPLPMRWVAEHRDYIPNRQFRDVQIVGPFARWEHTHRIEPDGPNACFLEDHIEYALSPSMQLGHEMIRRKLERLLRYRHRITAQDIAAHTAQQEMNVMNVLVSGSTGLIGTALSAFLTTGGHSVVRLVRTQTEKPDEVYWNPSGGELDAAALTGIDAVLHLAGESISEGRWNTEKKRRIRDSRAQGTQLLCNTLARLDTPPKTLVSASAIGFYGHRGDELLTEDSPAGEGFLADVCREWEAATAPAVDKGIRVVNFRIGVVLTPSGGALAKMLPPFQMGVGGVISTGRQYMSWISLDDVIGAIHHALTKDALKGPVNAVAPHAVTNAEFTKTLGKVLKRPTLFPLPAFALQLGLGEMADALLLASTRVQPTRLLQSGYAFRTPELEAALRHVLGK